MPPTRRKTQGRKPSPGRQALHITWITAFMLLATVWTTVPSKAVVLTKTAETPIDLALPLPPRLDGSLGTNDIIPDADEKPFFDKLDASERNTGDHFGSYDLQGKEGKFVSWLGIIRDIKTDPTAKTTTLTIQQTYCDGSKDTHMMVVSIFGSGDFVASLKGTNLPLLPLRLVRVYGTVQNKTNSKDALPTVAAEFVKEWDWGQYTFMDYGPDKRNPTWKELSKIDEKKVYSPFPQPKFYQERLGEAPSNLYSIMSPDQTHRYAELVQSAGPGLPKMVSPLTAPLFVGHPAKIVSEQQGNKMPVVVGFANPEAYVEFVQANMAHRQPQIKREDVTAVDADAVVDVIDFKLPESSSVAVYLVKPRSGAAEGKALWLPGFVLDKMP